MIDFVMTITTCVLSYSLIPQVKKSWREQKVELAWQTVILTVFGCWSLASCFFILGLVFNGIANAVTAGLWTALLIMKIIWKKG